MTENRPSRRKGQAAAVDGLELWHRLTRDIAPLRRYKPQDRGRPGRIVRAGETPAGPSPTPIAPAPTTLRPEPSVLSSPAPPLDRFTGIDRANAERLKRGKRAIEARLDLHGLTQREAHHALSGFVTASRAAGRRCVLVITGRGQLGGGILKQAVPRWLAEPELRRQVLAIAPAQPEHGGSGALYLLLRRVRQDAP